MTGAVPMARHKQAYRGERLTASFAAKCTPSERERLDAAAKAHGISLSDYARRTVFHRPIESRNGSDIRRNPEAAELCEQVRALGVNMNQIAHHLNATGEIRDIPEFAELCREIKAVFARIISL
jgi:Bacterial mobilisation protein (MobC)